MGVETPGYRLYSARDAAIGSKSRLPLARFRTGLSPLCSARRSNAQTYIYIYVYTAQYSTQCERVENEREREKEKYTASIALNAARSV